MMKLESSPFSFNTKYQVIPKKEFKNSYSVMLSAPIRDEFCISKKDSDQIISAAKTNNIIHISFKGKLENPIYTDTSAIQMKVRGVSNHQKSGINASEYATDDNVIDLADSNWKEGQKLNYNIITTRKGERIELSDPIFGPIGRVPDEIATPLIKLIKGKENNYRFELSNVIAGTSKGAATIGLRVNLKYIGKNENIKERAKQTFSKLLGSDDKHINSLVLAYQPQTSPNEVLKRIFSYEKHDKSSASAKQIKTAIHEISNEINNPENKNILLLGHCKPDGDTLGCVIGMQTAIKGAFPDKNVDCAVDDKIPGLFRDKMPGIEEVKRPYNPERIKMVENNIKTLKSKEQTPQIKAQIEILKKEFSDLTNPENLFDPNPINGEPRKKYDVVMLMDIPTPKRFSGAFKEYIENAKKVIYIDHHPHRVNEWKEAEETTGIDMEKIHNDNLALVCDSVPAATQLVTVIADYAGILDKTMQNNIEQAKKFVASIITGASTDTGSFTRTANLLPEHMEMPIDQRPNFLPEGLSKWLIENLNKHSKEEINKKWLRDTITFDVPDRKLSKKSEEGKLSPRDKMLTYAVNGRKTNPDLGIGFISIDYDQMSEIWTDSLKIDKDFTLLDVQNGFKYSEVMGALKADPTKVNYKAPRDKDNPTLKELANEVYSSPYEDDKIAILIIQDRKKDSITENSEISDKNGLRLSLRSSGASNHAELLASLFGGGGHGGAAGARIDLDNIELNSKLGVKIDGDITCDTSQIYKILKQNYEVLHDSTITPEQKKALSKEIEIVIDDTKQGLTATTLIENIVKEIRKEKPSTKDEVKDISALRKKSKSKNKHKNKKIA